MERILRSRSLNAGSSASTAVLASSKSAPQKAVRGNVKILKRRSKRCSPTSASSKVIEIKVKQEEEEVTPNKQISNGTSGASVKVEPSDSFSITNFVADEIKSENSASVKIEDEVKSTARVKFEPFQTNPLQVFPKKDETPANIFQKASPEDYDEIAAGSRAPKNWSQVYNHVVQMRSKFIAPVDTMGCERIPEQITPGLRYGNPKVFRFQLLISLMLSSQTKDEVNYDAVSRMNHYFITEAGFVDGLCIEAVLSTPESIIDSLIQKVGFHNRKSTYMKKSCQILKDNFDSDIPKTINEIVTLPGVGPKMGYLLLYKAWDISDGIGVDVHLHRLATMWHWAPKSEKPEVTRLALEKWLPKKFWGDINPLLVGFGQMICLPKGNKCDLCQLAVTGLCTNVNRKVLKLRGDPKRLQEVKKGRGDLSKLIADIEEVPL